jgi:tetratricopeptide (TPR) repeat protein
MLVWMKRAGCECIQLGVESGSSMTLSRLGKTITAHQVEVAAKLIRKVGISLSVFLISDIPGESERDVIETVELIKRIRPDDGYVSPLAYYPGTRLFEDAVKAGWVDRSIFENQINAAIYASSVTGDCNRRLLKQLAMQQNTGAVHHFKQQKNTLGFCFATNVLASEWYRQGGNYADAERELRDIVEQEPDNHWGWYLLAELCEELGECEVAKEYYRLVCDLVPEHQPSRNALNETGAKKKRDH